MAQAADDDASEMEEVGTSHGGPALDPENGAGDLSCGVSPVTPEGKEQAQIIKWAESTGFVVITTSEGRAVWRASGLPDLYLIHPALGVALWWEVKAPKGRMTATQEQFQALHEAAGRHAEARTIPGCYSGTAEDFGRFLERLGLAVLVNGVPGLLKPRLSQAWREWREAQQKQQLAAKRRKATPSPRTRT